MVVDGMGEGPRVAVFELGPVGPREVRVRVEAAGVCHSDLSLTNGTLQPDFPLVLGHEAAGVVVEAGPEVTGAAVGDPVVLNWSPACGECWFCARGEPWLCSAATGAASRARGSVGGVGLHVALGIGSLADEVVVDESAVVPLPAGLPFDLAALMGCAVLTGVGAVRNTARVQPGDSVVVVGVGGVGLSAVAGARWCGAEQVIAVDVGEAKAALAHQLGATDYVPAGPDAGKRIRALTGGRGADHALECVGTAATIRAAWGATRRGGQCVVVGVGRRDDPVTFTPMELYHFNRRLVSSVYGSSVPARDIALFAAAVQSGDLVLDGLITHRGTLDDVPAAFGRMRAGDGGRTVVRPG